MQCVTVAGFQATAVGDIRDFEARMGLDVLVFSVCNTLVRNSDVKYIWNADVVCASASRILRNQIGLRALLQIGTAIPVFALTEKRKELVRFYIGKLKKRLVVFKTQELPYRVESKEPKLRDPGADQKP